MANPTIVDEPMSENMIKLTDDLKSLITTTSHQLTQSQIKLYFKFFSESIPNGSHAKEIHKDEITNVLERIGYHISDVEKEYISKNLLRLSKENFISFDIFLEVLPASSVKVINDMLRVNEIGQKFDEYDLDGDGFISLMEAQRAVQTELDLSASSSLRLLTQFIKLDRQQFSLFYQQIQNKKLEIYKQFGKYDADLDGLISVEEAHSVLHQEFGFSRRRSQSIVDKFDLNRDGKVSYVEFAEFFMAIEEKRRQIRESFRRFDSQDCGYVLVEQAKQVMSVILGFSEEKCDQAIQKYDKNHNGKIEYEEFIKFFSSIEEQQECLLIEFKEFDVDEDGLITFEEFQQLLLKRGYTEDQMKKRLVEIKTEIDGFINFDEFKHILNL